MAQPFRPYKHFYSVEEINEMCRKADPFKPRGSNLISHFRPSFTDFFTGKSFVFHFDNGTTLRYEFKDINTLLWSQDGCPSVEEYYEALPSTVSNVYLFHHIRHDRIPFNASTIVIDMDRNLVTWVDLGIGTEESDKNVRTQIVFGWFSEDPGVRHSHTDEMCGVILDWKYSDDFIIRHSYVTTYSMTSPGAPTDNDDEYLFRKTLPATYVKIRSGLYLVSFIEDEGSEASLLIDLEKLRDVGAFFSLGHDGNFYSYTIGAVAGRGKFGFTGEYSIAYGPEAGC